MALGPGVVLGEVAGSVFCPRSPSRRLHCLLHRHSRPLTQDTPPVQSVVSGFSRTVNCRHDSWYAGCQDSIN